MTKIIGAVLVVLIPILLIAGVGGIATNALGASNPTLCAPGGSPGTGLTGYDADQMTNAATIVSVGAQLNVPTQGHVVAIAAALQESGLHNLNHGDRDSLGLFQERPSQGWGSPTQIMNPTYAATQFYRHLLTVPGWQRMTINDAAQAVERSAFPDAYAPHEPSARQIVAAVQNATCATNPSSGTAADAGACDHVQAPNPAALVAVEFACGQRGLPYKWGGNGPQDGGFDCSGLTTAAYTAAGIPLPRTAQTQYDHGPLLPAQTPLQPGDLVFYGAGPTSITHVGIAIAPNLIIDAPHPGATVRVDSTGRYLAASRPASTVPVQVSAAS